MAIKAPTIEELWMQRAIEVASACVAQGELPFGCLVIGPDGEELVKTWGTGRRDPLAHSEMMAIHLLADRFSEPDWFRGCTLVSTMEPCPMCCGGINHAKFSQVIFGSYRDDLPQLFRPKRSAHSALSETSHPPLVLGGVLRQECIQLFQGIAKWDTVPEYNEGRPPEGRPPIAGGEGSFAQGLSQELCPPGPEPGSFSPVRPDAP